MRIVVTGSEGLIGSAISLRLAALGHQVIRLDLLLGKDVRSPRDVREAVDGSDGVIHLAAVSRVVWGERDPALCFHVNVGGTLNVLQEAWRSPSRPWVIHGSSREVYGQPVDLPVRENAPFAPLNHYARSKVAAEYAVTAWAGSGVSATVVRFSTVYGSAHDHADRVVPAFCAAAATGGTLRLDGQETTLDFTHVDDVTVALERLVNIADRGPYYPLHLVSGRGTTLADLAGMAVSAAGGQGQPELDRPRRYDATCFTGDPQRARAVLGWKATTTLEDGIARLVKDFRERL